MVRGKIAGNTGKTIDIAFRNRFGERDRLADLDVEVRHVAPNATTPVRQSLAFTGINDTMLVL